MPKRKESTPDGEGGFRFPSKGHACYLDAEVFMASLATATSTVSTNNTPPHNPDRLATPPLSSPEDSRHCAAPGLSSLQYDASTLDSLSEASKQLLQFLSGEGATPTALLLRGDGVYDALFEAVQSISEGDVVAINEHIAVQSGVSHPAKRRCSNSRGRNVVDAASHSAYDVVVRAVALPLRTLIEVIEVSQPKGMVLRIQKILIRSLRLLALVVRPLLLSGELLLHAISPLLLSSLQTSSECPTQYAQCVLEVRGICLAGVMSGCKKQSAPLFSLLSDPFVRHADVELAHSTTVSLLEQASQPEVASWVVEGWLSGLAVVGKEGGKMEAAALIVHSALLAAEEGVNGGVIFTLAASDHSLSEHVVPHLPGVLRNAFLPSASGNTKRILLDIISALLPGSDRICLEKKETFLEVLRSTILRFVSDKEVLTSAKALRSLQIAAGIAPWMDEGTLYDAYSQCIGAMKHGNARVRLGGVKALIEVVSSNPHRFVDVTTTKVQWREVDQEVTNAALDLIEFCSASPSFSETDAKTILPLLASLLSESLSTTNLEAPLRRLLFLPFPEAIHSTFLRDILKTILFPSSERTALMGIIPDKSYDDETLNVLGLSKEEVNKILKVWGVFMRGSEGVINCAASLRREEGGEAGEVFLKGVWQALLVALEVPEEVAVSVVVLLCGVHGDVVLLEAVLSGVQIDAQNSALKSATPHLQTFLLDICSRSAWHHPNSVIATISLFSRLPIPWNSNPLLSSPIFQAGLIHAPKEAVRYLTKSEMDPRALFYPLVDSVARGAGEVERDGAVMTPRLLEVVHAALEGAVVMWEKEAGLRWEAEIKEKPIASDQETEDGGDDDASNAENYLKTDALAREKARFLVHYCSTMLSRGFLAPYVIGDSGVTICSNLHHHDAAMIASIALPYTNKGFLETLLRSCLARFATAASDVLPTPFSVAYGGADLSQCDAMPTRTLCTLLKRILECDALCLGDESMQKVIVDMLCKFLDTALPALEAGGDALIAFVLNQLHLIGALLQKRVVCDMGLVLACCARCASSSNPNVAGMAARSVKTFIEADPMPGSCVVNLLQALEDGAQCFASRRVVMMHALSCLAPPVLPGIALSFAAVVSAAFKGKRGEGRRSGAFCTVAGDAAALLASEVLPSSRQAVSTIYLAVKSWSETKSDSEQIPLSTATSLLKMAKRAEECKKGKKGGGGGGGGEGGGGNGKESLLLALVHALTGCGEAPKGEEGEGRHAKVAVERQHGSAVGASPDAFAEALAGLEALKVSAGPLPEF